MLCWTRTTVPTAKVGIFAVVDGAELGKVADLESYGFKLLLPEDDKPDKSGWKRKVIDRRPEVARLVKALGGKR